MNGYNQAVALLYLVLIKGVTYLLAWRFAGVYCHYQERKSQSDLGHDRGR